ncbi:MAG: hypothetical protein A2Z40_03655 [Deltaproteobacteria bacterium RBG_19FT_COMBO_60_16]|nr:MAG: hypothetical protein A2Z40_03655 [Deltaproteobacteria bacterium RBG_19FT_COMBO_60_16]
MSTIKELDFPPPPPRQRAIRLNNARDTRRFLSRLINGLMRDEIDESKAGKAGYLVGIMLKVIETYELEQRVSKLEHTVLGKSGGRK